MACSHPKPILGNRIILVPRGSKSIDTVWRRTCLSYILWRTQRNVIFPVILNHKANGQCCKSALVPEIKVGHCQQVLPRGEFKRSTLFPKKETHHGGSLAVTILEPNATSTFTWSENLPCALVSSVKSTVDIIIIVIGGCRFFKWSTDAEC